MGLLGKESWQGEDFWEKVFFLSSDLFLLTFFPLILWGTIDALIYYFIGFGFYCLGLYGLKERTYRKKIQEKQSVFYMMGWCSQDFDRGEAYKFGIKNFDTYEELDKRTQNAIETFIKENLKLVVKMYETRTPSSEEMIKIEKFAKILTGIQLEKKEKPELEEKEKKKLEVKSKKGKGGT